MYAEIFSYFATLTFVAFVIQYSVRAWGGILWLRRVWLMQKTFYVLMFVAALLFEFLAGSRHPLGHGPLLLFSGPVLLSFGVASITARYLGLQAEPVQADTKAVEFGVVFLAAFLALAALMVWIVL